MVNLDINMLMYSIFILYNIKFINIISMVTQQKDPRDNLYMAG